LAASDESPQSFAGAEALQVFKAKGVFWGAGAPPLADLPRRPADEHAGIKLVTIKKFSKDRYMVFPHGRFYRLELCDRTLCTPSINGIKP
jgi:hypothetical protein